MAQKQQEQRHPVADKFTDPEMEQIQRFGQALGGQPSDFDEEVEHELNVRQRAREASAGKMHAAQTGGSVGLGPTEAEESLAHQQQALQQQAATQGQAQATQAQSQQPGPPSAPPAPTGSAGVTTPFPAQKGPAAAGAPGGGEPPPAPGSEEEEGQEQQQS